jgi:hypothetical protein
MFSGRAYKLFWQPFLALLFVTLYLPTNTLFPAFASLSLPARVGRGTKPHADYCHCRRCPGESVCCCKPAQSPANAAAMRALCDLGDEALLWRSRSACVMPAVRSTALFLSVAATELPAYLSSLSSPSSLPDEPPPRLS